MDEEGVSRGLLLIIKYRRQISYEAPQLPVVSQQRTSGAMLILYFIFYIHSLRKE